MASETRACPVTPDRVREIARSRGLGWGDKMANDLNDLADWLADFRHSIIRDLARSEVAAGLYDRIPADLTDDAAASEPTCVCGPTYDNYCPVHCPQPASPAAPAPPVDAKREHAISFAYGNVHLSNPSVTREMIEKAYDEMHPPGAAPAPRVLTRERAEDLYQYRLRLRSFEEFIARLRELGIEVEEA